MKEDVAALAELYSNGIKAKDHLSELYGSLVPIRSYVETPNFITGRRLGFSEPEPEHPRTIEFLQITEQRVNSWKVGVSTVLDRIGRTRYSLQFNMPDDKSSFRMIGKLTDNEEKLCNIIDDFNQCLVELRKIIIDYESIGELAPQATKQAIEPASYDPKTRTIFFADEAIRFNKNAEYQSAICSLIFKKPEATWGLKDFLSVWDTQYDYLPDLQKPSDWNKVYEIIKKMNMRVASATGIKDLFKLSTKSVRLNPKYITQSKKRP